MNILITGATGFIASQVVTDLLAAGHQVTCAVRNTAYAKNLFPQAKIIACDFIHDTDSAIWLPRLQGIDVVINCVGILYHPKKKIIWQIHYETPKALFDAAVAVGVKRIIQISALGCDKTSVDYALSKKTADDYLRTLPIKSVILRPSLVYGRGSYGGTSLFRGLAGLPWITPVPGNGEQSFQPIYLADLSQAVLRLLTLPLQATIILHAVSQQQCSLKEVLTTLRAWLGFAKAKLVKIPLALIRFASFLGDAIPYSSLNSSSYKMLVQNNITSEEETKRFQETIGFKPRNFLQGVYAEPSSVQDHWHARLYFLKPLLQVGVAFVWIMGGICSLFFSHQQSYHLLAAIGVASFWQPVLLYGASLLDLILGLALLLNYQVKKICLLQLVIMIVYTLIISWKLPAMWLDPFGAIVKNIPLIIAILIFLALESDR
ncbi:MAG: conserved rane protein of unknown function [Gammaproteobacteria bacterium]|jgi:uncharacterized protein YbjT (DUF2867 family)|nr:conserved rane protein of unknown function [Gammaproteobacteria bacterium]